MHLLAVLAGVFLLLPLIALCTRVAWTDIIGIALREDSLQMFALSLGSAVVATLCCLVLGIPLALWLQLLPRGAGLARGLVLLPLAMPPVVAGLALSAAFGRKGLVAPLLDATGIQLAFSFAGVVMAHCFIALPFVVVTVDAALRQFDREIWYSAQAVGMTPTQVVRRVLLPGVRPAILSGAGLAFVRSLGEFGTTLTFAGSLPGVTRTLPVGIYLARETDPDQAYALAALLVLLAVAVLAAVALLGRSPRVRTQQAVELRPVDVAALSALSASELGAPSIKVDDFYAQAGHTTALIGPNGAGKTTLLGKIAGRISAQVFIDGKPISEPMWQRGIVMLTQQPGLPRHCSVEQAIAMVHPEAARLLEAAGLEALANVPTAELSGGQAAQVALLRALAARPRVLLLDEPLAAVDVEAAQHWRALLAAAAKGRTVVFISHDPTDVATLSSKIAVLEQAQVRSIADTQEEFSRPSNSFVASFAGVNRLEGVVQSVEHGIAEMRVGDLHVVAQADGDLAVHDRAVAVFAPDAVTLKVVENPAGVESARNQWEGRITSVEFHKNIVFVRVKFATASITLHTTQASALRLSLGVGSSVICAIKALNVHVYRAPTPHASTEEL
ncbi:ATP-binding cassette domain-containing protein [Corynebacterium pseudopelargi]|uniref:ATP-binding cassette domain-containing protein n=1 Tax=Corynebacterium pseudopelargi TaxID=2080757 RepID=UPI001FEA4EC6|nr:ATP-binding cassette domain-containing protein [Corynebacterium pseudopelargi]